MKLTRETVIAEARALVNETGLDGLTTRNLGERLGVKGPALYRHFKSKQDIITALSQTFFVGAPVPPPDMSWQEWLKFRAHSTRREILSCRDGARIAVMARPHLTEKTRDTLLAPLTDAGFDKREALLNIHLIGRLVIGWTLSEQEHGGQIPPASMGIEPESAFEYVIGCIVAGLEMRLMAKRMAGSAG